MVSFRYQSAMTVRSTSSDEIAEFLVHIGRSSRGEDMRSDLTAAQWTCLRFFSRANKLSRTPSAFASFQATTRGTATQTIKILESKGLLLRYRSDLDGRSVRLEITVLGLEILNSDPLADLISVINVLRLKEQTAFLATLSDLSITLAQMKGRQTFGTCEECIHYVSILGAADYCACIAAELAPVDIGKICVNFGAAGVVQSPPIPLIEINKGRAL